MVAVLIMRRKILQNKWEGLAMRDSALYCSNDVNSQPRNRAIVVEHRADIYLMMATSKSFVPKGNAGLLLRSPLTNGFSPTVYKTQSSDDPKDAIQSLSDREQQLLREQSMPRRTGYYARNNPHPGRVRHIKGFLDVPICSVEDNASERELSSPPAGSDFGLPYRPPGGTRYGANEMKDIPAVGVVPITYAWHDELERKTHGAIDRALGRTHAPPSRASVGSRSAQRTSNQEFSHISHEMILEMLCKILQTKSIPACQAWLANATTTEKNVVLNMLRMSALGELEGVVPAHQSRPQTRESQIQYVWKPNQGEYRGRKEDNTHEFRSTGDVESYQPYGQGQQKSVEAEFRALSRGLRDPQPRHLEHASVMQAARKIATSGSQRPGSRGQRTRSMDLEEVRALRLATSDGSHRRRPQSAQSRHHHRLPPLGDQPMLTGPSLSVRHHPRSRSATPLRTIAPMDYMYPPPPMRVAVSKEMLRSGREGQAGRLRHTSTWGDTSHTQ